MPMMIFSAIALHTINLVAQVPIQESSFKILKKQLEQTKFQVILDLPPQRGAYGLLKSDSKKIWINPVVFDLGIADQTLIHEAVHAAQVSSISADRVVIVCKDSEEKIILSLLNQIGWKTRI